MAGGLAAAVAGPATAAVAPRLLFAAGPLAGNSVARRFQRPPAGLRRPAGTVDSGAGPRRFADLRGSLRIVSLWAEWCAPCLLELPDLAALGARYQGRGFEVLAVLTGSGRKLGWRDAHALLDGRGARLPLWVEPDGGSTWLGALADAGGQPTLPCNLIVDRAGVVRGRSFGASPSAPMALDARGGRLTDLGKAQILASGAHTLWATPQADAFVQALLAGALGRTA